MDYNLIKVFSTDWEGTNKERERLSDLQRQLRDEFYIEVIYILTHKIIKDVKEAKEMYKDIINHKESLAKKLKRNVGIEVAALDYMKNIRSILDKPEIIEKDKLLGLATKAILDEGTDIYDRTTLFANLNADVDRARRYGRPLSLLFCDIDDFKKINDTLGHETGNTILKMISQNIRDALRETDMPFRYGGEEFVCILPETDIKSASIVARRLRQRVAKLKNSEEVKKQNLKVTVSVGIAQFGLNGIEETHSFVDAADQAMYQAKRTGKNRVCAYGIDFKKGQQKKKADKATKETKEISGQVLSSGIAMGRAFIYRDILTRDLLYYSLKEEEIEEEFKRIQDALDEVQKEIHQTKEIVKETVNEEHANIFEAHKMILKDEKLLIEIEKELNQELLNAEQVIRNVFRRWSKRFRSSENEFIQDKADDMDDLSRRIIRQLLGYERNVLETLPHNSIIVTKRLLPSDTVHLNRKNVKGIVLEEGGYNSHSAILSRSLGVPAICCHINTMDTIKKNTFLLLDANNGKVVINPKENLKKKFEEKIKSFQKDKNLMFRKTKQKAATKDGQTILVQANAANIVDFEEAMKNGCDGIGLFRIESLYLEHKTAPSEDYLLKQFNKILKYASKKQIVIRLLDVGGDKQLSYINVEEESNPFLGLRGVRLLLKHKKILKTQIRVICNLLDEFDVKLLIPMISLPKEVVEVKQCVKEIKDELKIDSRIDIGAMIETPASVINIEQIAQVSDFLSIGTNDLIQYTMAVGRENMSMTQYYHEGVETVMKLIKNTVDAAKKYSIPCCVCGEIAGDEQYIEPLLRAGMRELSVSPIRIPLVKEKIRTINLKTSAK